MRQGLLLTVHAAIFFSNELSICQLLDIFREFIRTTTLKDMANQNRFL